MVKVGAKQPLLLPQKLHNPETLGHRSPRLGERVFLFLSILLKKLINFPLYAKIHNPPYYVSAILSFLIKRIKLYLPPDASHQVTIVAQIVHSGKADGERLAGKEKMAQVRAGVVGAEITAAGVVGGGEIFGVAGGLDGGE